MKSTAEAAQTDVTSPQCEFNEMSAGSPAVVKGPERTQTGFISMLIVIHLHTDQALLALVTEQRSF